MVVKALISYDVLWWFNVVHKMEIICPFTHGDSYLHHHGFLSPSPWVVGFLINHTVLLFKASSFAQDLLVGQKSTFFISFSLQKCVYVYVSWLECRVIVDICEE